MFLNLIQKGWVGDVERKSQCVTVERQDGGRRAQWLGEQMPAPDDLD